MTMTLLDLARLLPGHPAQDDASVARLKEELVKEHGVQAVRLELSPASATLSVHHSGSVLSATALERAARRMGSEVQAQLKHETIQLGGLHCKDCAVSIERVVGRLPGVASASASYATEKLHLCTTSVRRDFRTSNARSLTSATVS